MAISQESSPFSDHHRLQRKVDLQWTTPNVRIDPKNAGDVHGHVFWLPAEEDVPRRTARRTHDNDIVDGPNEYPVVVASRPAEEIPLAYTNRTTTDIPRLSLERWFRKRLLDEKQVLNKQESGLQYQSHPPTSSMRIKAERNSEHTEPALYRSVSGPQSLPARLAQKVDAGRYPGPDDPTLRALDEYSGSAGSPQSALGAPGVVENGTSSLTPQVSPDTEAKSAAHNSVSWDAWQPVDRVLKRIAAGFEEEALTKRIVVRRPMAQVWTNTKGVMAVVIASV